MGDNGARLLAVKNELSSYFEVLVDDGYCKPNTMGEGDYDYLASKILTAVRQVELDREYAV